MAGRQARLSDRVRALGESERAEIRSFYWESDIPALEIAHAYGLKPSEVTQAAGPIVIPHNCAWCDDPEIVTSRTQRDERIAWWSDRDASRPAAWSYGGRCESCNEAFRTWEQLDRKSESPRSPYRSNATTERTLRALPYDQYLETPHWKEARKKALNRAQWRCELCASRDNLNVHHRSYERLGRELYHDLIVLCRECHVIFHSHRKVA